MDTGFRRYDSGIEHIVVPTEVGTHCGHGYRLSPV
jgi:hypothetical protein